MGLKEDMMEMGFGEFRTIRACRAVQYSSMERAIAWLENHEGDADLDDPIEESGGNVLGSAADPSQPLPSTEEVVAVERTPEEIAAKAAAVQAKLAERRRAVEEKDKQDAILKEKIRRKEGQSLAEMKEKLEADAMKKLAEERKKQKLADQQAKKEILEKIKQDKANRSAAKNKPAEQVAAPAPAAVPAAPPKDYDECRLQLRLPTGQPIVNSFKAEDTLGDVVAFIRDTSSELQEFSLMTSFPRKVYQASDFGFSLKSLGLCPSSVLIVSLSKN